MCGRTTHASDRHPDRGRRARRLDRGRHAGPHRPRNGAGRSACDLSAGLPRREARQHADRGAAQDRCGRRGAARSDARRRKLGRALRPAAREAAGRPARHPLRHDGQHDARRDSAGRRHHPRQGDGCRDERGPPDRHALDRRTDFRTPCRGGERAQRRPAPQARHGAARHLQDALDHARLRSRARGREAFRFRRSPITASIRRTAPPTSRCFRLARRCARTSASIASWTTRG